MSALVQVNSANRCSTGAIVCSLELLGKDYVVTFRYRDGHLTPDCFFDQELFSIGITMALTLGLDKVTGMAMVVVGAASGFTAGLMNPFTVGIAQDIAGVPLFSGMGLRAVLLVILLVVDTAYIIAYERKIKKYPEKSILAGMPDEKDFVADKNADEKRNT